MKVMTIIGTRPEIIKLAQTIKKLDEFTEHILVHTGQNFDYELNNVFFKDLAIREPDYFLGVAEKSIAHTIGNIITKSDEVMEKESPNAILLYGDTNSCLAAVSAKRRKIPIFHMEAGNRCFDQCVPEEINRKIVDHLADINMVLTEHARRYLIREGIPQETIIKTGSSMKELLEIYAPKIDSSSILQDLHLKENEYFVVSAHREENVDDERRLLDLIDSLNALAEKYKYPLIFSTHPRTKVRLVNLNRDFSKNIVFLKPFGFFDYIKLQKNAFCVLSDSGTVTEESSILKFPAVTIRCQHERPEGMDAGTLIMCGLKKNMILESVKIVTEQSNDTITIIEDYDVSNVSTKVVRIIMSYVDYVNRTVWKKNV